jgi:hypothetical protein
MVVNSQYIGSRVTGLYVGEGNVRRHFRRRVAEIELHLDHLRIQCELAPSFWRDKPEIRDPRLCLWLESKRRSETVPLAMVRLGKNSFLLGPINRRAARRVRIPQPA